MRIKILYKNDAEWFLKYYNLIASLSGLIYFVKNFRKYINIKMLNFKINSFDFRVLQNI